MAFFDWNGNGKKDMQDNYFEFMIFQNSTKSNNPSPSDNGKGSISTFGAILSVIAGLVLQAILYTVLGIDVDKVPVIVILILWVVFSTLTACLAEKIGM